MSVYAEIPNFSLIGEPVTIDDVQLFVGRAENRIFVEAVRQAPFSWHRTGYPETWIEELGDGDLQIGVNHLMQQYCKVNIDFDNLFTVPIEWPWLV